MTTEVKNRFKRLSGHFQIQPNQKDCDSNNIDAFKVTFKRDGLDLWLLDENWGDKPMFITWGAMRSYMKYSFL